MIKRQKVFSFKQGFRSSTKESLDANPCLDANFSAMPQMGHFAFKH